MLTGCYDESTAQGLIELFDRDACEDSIGRKRFSQLHEVVLGLTPGEVSLELQTPDGLQAMNTTDVQGFTPLMWAAKAGNLVAVKTLLRFGADVSIRNSFNNDVVSCAVMSTATAVPAILESLLEAGCSPNVPGIFAMYPVHACTLYRDDPGGYIKPLLDYGADVYATWGPLSLFDLAITMNRVNTVAFLLNIQAFSLTSLEEQIAHLKNAIDHNSKKSPRSISSFTDPLILGHEVLEFLIDYGVEINVVSKDGQTLLHFAAATADCQTLEILAARALAINTSIRDSAGKSAAEIFASRNGKDTALVKSFHLLVESVQPKSQPLICKKASSKADAALKECIELGMGGEESDNENYFDAYEN